MNSGAVGHDYHAALNKHASQKDYATGFGGKYGVQDRQDKVGAMYYPATVQLIHFECFLDGTGEMAGSGSWFRPQWLLSRWLELF